MSEELIGLNMQIPKAVHKKAKDDAKRAGISLKVHIIGLIETGIVDVADSSANEVLSLLPQPRTSQRFGDETILQEILRRLIVVQLLTTEELVENKGKDATRQLMDRIDGITEKIADQR